MEDENQLVKQEKNSLVLRDEREAHPEVELLLNLQRELAFFYGVWHSESGHNLDAVRCRENECVRVRQLLHSPISGTRATPAPSVNDVRERAERAARALAIAGHLALPSKTPHDFQQTIASVADIIAAEFAPLTHERREDDSELENAAKSTSFPRSQTAHESVAPSDTKALTVAFLKFATVRDLLDCNEDNSLIDPTCSRCTEGNTPAEWDRGLCLYHAVEQFLAQTSEAK